jgi:hypothetical protein
MHGSSLSNASQNLFESSSHPMRISDFSLWHFVIVIVILITMSHLFDHEKLEADQASLSFIAWLEPVLLKANSGYQLHEDSSDYDYDYTVTRRN